MTKEEAKEFGLRLLHGIMERNESYPVYANNVKQAIDALSETSGSSETLNGCEEAAKEYIKGYGYANVSSIYYAFIAGAKWQRKQMMDEWLKDHDGCFWDGVNEGKKAMKEQMMSEAVEGEFLYTPYPTIELDDCKDYDFKDGDKVRVIVCKKED